MPGKRFSGLIVPPHTPFDRSGELNLATVERQAERFAASHVTGVFVAGSTGEGPSQTIEERQRVAQRWIDVGKGAGLDVLVQVGTPSVAQSKALAAHAQQIGAAGIGCLPAFYLKPDSVDALVAYCAAVAAAAPELPFYYYHIPRLTFVDLSMVEFLEKGSKKIPNLAGMKFTHQELGQAMRCMAVESGRFNILLGWDEGWLAGLGIGIQGAIGNTFNFAAPIYHRTRKYFEEGNLEAARARTRSSADHDCNPPTAREYRERFQGRHVLHRRRLRPAAIAPLAARRSADRGLAGRSGADRVFRLGGAVKRGAPFRKMSNFLRRRRTCR